MMMGRRQRGIRLLWTICWERDKWHRVERGAKTKANRQWRKQLKRVDFAESRSYLSEETP
jgi:hypothetical protein